MILLVVIICLFGVGCNRNKSSYDYIPSPSQANYVLQEPSKDVINWKNNLLTKLKATEVSLLQQYITTEDLSEYKPTGFWFLLVTNSSNNKIISAYDANQKCEANINMLGFRNEMFDVLEESSKADQPPIFWMNVQESWLVCKTTDMKLVIYPVSPEAKQLAGSFLSEKEYLEGYRKNLIYIKDGEKIGNHVYTNFSWRK